MVVCPLENQNFYIGLMVGTFDFCSWNCQWYRKQPFLKDNDLDMDQTVVFPYVC